MYPVRAVPPASHKVHAVLHLPSGVLAFWIEEFLESGEGAVSLLSADARAAILAVARRKARGQFSPDGIYLVVFLICAYTNRLSKSMWDCAMLVVS